MPEPLAGADPGLKPEVTQRSYYVVPYARSEQQKHHFPRALSFVAGQTGSAST